MRLLYHSLAFYLTLHPTLTAAATSTTTTSTATHSASSTSHASASATVQACTIRSPNTHAFFDLNSLHIPDPASAKTKHPRPNSWNVSGYDLGYNFTVNFCGAVIEDLSDKGGVVGVEKNLWNDVGAYYEQGGKVYSLGQASSAPVFRGRKLVMNYTDGSPCGADAMKREHVIEDLGPREIIDPDKDKKKNKPSKGHEDDDDDEDDDRDGRKDEPKKGAALQRKSTIISFLCDKDPLAPLLTLSFIGASPDQCTYVFEARSSAGCSGIEVAKQTLSPSGVFGVIVGIAILVYIVGGCVYSRMVLHQRGWQQLPNYALWKGVFGFFKDLVIILTSSCTRFFPSRRGYTRVNGGLGGNSGGIGRNGRGRGDSDAENRLIDELNEEWDD
ncbi:hypothetical protein LTR62_001104 [Meristemomyces frigidus]|uniref:MRH domain-containing protein n=1 Tax=Meristemomyces frigidus TaxID=1508187 RepID=A0AAN7TBT5_9PEZI|nr:hypothetical protein LTR62_001104 [Meristemomyces frigidus]